MDIKTHGGTKVRCSSIFLVDKISYNYRKSSFGFRQHNGYEYIFNLILKL